MAERTMNRLDRIWNHPVYKAEMEGLERDEADRIFCRHGMSHIMDVARICTIYCLEDNLIDEEELSVELIYATAMLHDIGRHGQYKDGTPHEQAGARIAERVLAECGFGEHEIRTVVGAIAEHRDSGSIADAFAERFRRADKKSRPCYMCSARSLCNWPEEKMNLKIGI